MVIMNVRVGLKVMVKIQIKLQLGLKQGYISLINVMIYGKLRLELRLAQDKVQIRGKIFDLQLGLKITLKLRVWFWLELIYFQDFIILWGINRVELG